MKIRNLFFLLAAISTSAATAGNYPGAVTLTLADAYYAFSTKRHIDNIAMPNFELAYNFDEIWAVEAGYGIINTDQKPALGNSSVHGGLFTLDGIYRFTPGKMFEPYVLAGIGIIGLNPNGNDSENQGNINAGIGTQIFFDKTIALRGEVKDFYTMSGGKNDVMLNFGVSFLF